MISIGGGEFAKNERFLASKPLAGQTDGTPARREGHQSCVPQCGHMVRIIQARTPPPPRSRSRSRGEPLRLLSIAESAICFFELSLGSLELILRVL